MIKVRLGWDNTNIDIFNSDSKNKLNDNLTISGNVASQQQKAYVPIVGYSYGKKEPGKKKKAVVYTEAAGEDFWTLLTGDKDFYRKIIGYMDGIPEKYADSFRTAYDNAANRLMLEFLSMFCNEDGSIDWDKLVRYNSESTMRMEKKKYERCRDSIIRCIREDASVTKKRMAECAGVSISYLNRTIRDMMEEGTISKDGRIWKL